MQTSKFCSKLWQDVSWIDSLKSGIAFQLEIKM